MVYLPVPFDCCYWVLPGRLLAGCCPGDIDPAEAQKKLHRLFGAGIRHIVNLIGETENESHLLMNCSKENGRHAETERSDLTFSHWPVRNTGVLTREHMIAVLDEIDVSIVLGRPVYIHSRGEKSRTETVVGCYLARHAFASGERVLDMIRKLTENGHEARYHPLEDSGRLEMALSWSIGE